MTEPKSLRRRRVATASGIPPAVESWFAGAAPTPWDALLAPERVPAWWRAWLAENPGAKPPRNSFINFEAEQ